MNSIIKIFETIGKIFAFIILCVLTTPIGAILITMFFSKLDKIEENTKQKNKEQE